MITFDALCCDILNSLLLNMQLILIKDCSRAIFFVFLFDMKNEIYASTSISFTCAIHQTPYKLGKPAIRRKLFLSYEITII